jgi:ActR/RegA family two-component response regulator
MPELSKKDLINSYLTRYLRHSQQNPYRHRLPTLDELRRDYIRFCLTLTEDNYSETARLLKVKPGFLKKLTQLRLSSS